MKKERFPPPTLEGKAKPSIGKSKKHIPIRSSLPFFEGKVGGRRRHISFPTNLLGKKCIGNIILLGCYFVYYFQPSLFLSIQSPSSCFHGKVTTWAWGWGFGEEEAGVEKVEKNYLSGNDTAHKSQGRGKQIKINRRPLFFIESWDTRGVLGRVSRKTIQKIPIIDADYTLPNNHQT